MIKIKDTLILDGNKKYVVISIANYENKTYYYLIDRDNNSNIKFCYLDNNELVEICDKILIIKLLPMFLVSGYKKISL